MSPALPPLPQEHLWPPRTCPIRGGPDEGGQHLHGGGGVGVRAQPLLHLLLETLGHLQQGLVREPHVVQVLVHLRVQTEPRAQAGAGDSARPLPSSGSRSGAAQRAGRGSSAGIAHARHQHHHPPTAAPLPGRSPKATLHALPGPASRERRPGSCSWCSGAASRQAGCRHPNSSYSSGNQLRAGSGGRQGRFSWSPSRSRHHRTLTLTPGPLPAARRLSRNPLPCHFPTAEITPRAQSHSTARSKARRSDRSGSWSDTSEAGVTQARGRGGKKSTPSPVPGNCRTLELRMLLKMAWKHLVLPGKGTEKLLPSHQHVPERPGRSRERERRHCPSRTVPRSN